MILAELKNPETTAMSCVNIKGDDEEVFMKKLQDHILKKKMQSLVHHTTKKNFLGDGSLSQIAKKEKVLMKINFFISLKLARGIFYTYCLQERINCSRELFL